MSVFLIIGAIGLVILLVSLLFGEAIEGVLDLDFLGGDLFSTASIAAFLGAFGFGGVIALSLIQSIGWAVAVGLVAGGLATWGAASLTRWLKSGENQAVLRSDTLVGAPARVITDLPAGSYGEVLVRVAGRNLKRSAKSEVPIPRGTEVWVSGILSPTAVQVTPARGLTQTEAFPELPDPDNPH